MTDVVDIEETPDLDPTTEQVLRSIYERDGKLTADNVVAEAVDPDHPLHGRFQWDDSVAAHEYRLAQARCLIRAVVITVDERPVRAFPFIKSAETYAPMNDVIRNDDWRAEMVARFIRDAELFKKRWENHRYVAQQYEQWIKKQAAEMKRKK